MFNFLFITALAFEQKKNSWQCCHNDGLECGVEGADYDFDDDHVGCDLDNHDDDDVDDDDDNDDGVYLDVRIKRI